MALEIRIEDIMRDTLGTTNLNDLHSTKYEKGETKMEEQLRVIMTLVFDGNPEKNTSGTFNYVNYGSEYFPQIKSFNKYWDITGSIEEVIGLNNALDYKNANNKGSTLFKIAYLVTDELYRSVTNDFYFDPRDLSEDISNGRFFDRDLHEELVKAFFNTPEYLHELDISGILDSIVTRGIAENTNHLKFVTNDNKILLLGKDTKTSQSDASSYIEYKDTQYVESLVKRYEEYRKELKQFIFDLAKKGLDDDTLQPLINAAGTLKGVNEYLEEADIQFKKLYKEKFNEAPNTEYITETKRIKNENYKEGNGEPEFITQTCILPNPNYIKENKASKITETVAKLPGTFVEKMNELSEANVLEKLLTPEQKEIVKKNTEAFAKAFEELTSQTAKRMQEALKNMEKFNKENKEDK